MKRALVSLLAIALAAPVGSSLAAPPASSLILPEEAAAGDRRRSLSNADEQSLAWTSDQWEWDASPSTRRAAGSAVTLAQAADGAPPADPPAPATADADPANPDAAAAEGGGATALGAAIAGLQTVLNADPTTLDQVDASLLRARHDAATLLRNVPGVSVEAHAPNMHESMLRGRRLGQVPAKGSYWFPARQDLDTLMSKIDSTMVDNIVIYKGPYSALYGPGLGFYAIELLRAPQYDAGSGFQGHSQSLLQYETNGEQWNGRQAVWGGDEVWGYRGGYSHRGGSDYETGDGTELPASYKSRQADLALGAWLTPDSRLDFQYLRLDQTDLEFPGQFFDINALVTDAFEGTFLLQDQGWVDLLTADAWYNRTNFYGDNLRPGKRELIPALDNEQTVVIPGVGSERITTQLNSFTNVGAHSAGFRTALNWGNRDDGLLTAGADLRYLGQRIDEINELNFTRQTFSGNGEPLGPPISGQIRSSNPLPKGYSSNPGAFAEFQQALTEDIRLRTGGRFDLVDMNAAQTLPGVPVNMSEALGGDFNQSFNLGAGFMQLDLLLTEAYTLNTGVGYAMRPPTMTEMYAFGPFIAVLPQNIFTSLFGDPNLDPERMTQIDFGVTGDHGDMRSGLHGYHAWVDDFITFDFLNTVLPNGNRASVAYGMVNTPRATLAGFEAYGEADLVPMVTAFSTLSYVEGRDHSRRSTISRQRQLRAPTSANSDRSRQLVFDPGSGNFIPTGPEITNDDEPLPVIAPLSGRVGFRVHEPTAAPLWSVDFLANVYDNQDRVASTLREFTTPGFTTYDILGFYRVGQRSVLSAGVKNLTDKQYQTYFDTRQAGSAPVTEVFQPGISFVFGWEFTL